MGKKYLEFMLQPDSVNMDTRKEVAPRYARNFSSGKVNCYPLPIIYDTFQISPDIVYNSVSEYYPNCRNMLMQICSDI
jgi:hypothetical protein